MVLVNSQSLNRVLHEIMNTETQRLIYFFNNSKSIKNEIMRKPNTHRVTQYARSIRSIPELNGLSNVKDHIVTILPAGMRFYAWIWSIALSWRPVQTAKLKADSSNHLSTNTHLCPTPMTCLVTLNHLATIVTHEVR